MKTLLYNVWLNNILVGQVRTELGNTVLGPNANEGTRALLMMDLVEHTDERDVFQVVN